MLAFLGVDQSECACDDPCPSVKKFVKLYIYRAYVWQLKYNFYRIFGENSVYFLFLEKLIAFKDFSRTVRMHI